MSVYVFEIRWDGGEKTSWSYLPTDDSARNFARLLAQDFKNSAEYRGSARMVIKNNEGAVVASIPVPPGVPPALPNVRHGTGTVLARQALKAQPMTSHFNDPAYWRARSDEVRAIADTLKDSEAKRIMLDIATDYDVLAQRAEQRLANGSKFP